MTAPFDRACYERLIANCEESGMTVVASDYRCLLAEIDRLETFIVEAPDLAALESRLDRQARLIEAWRKILKQISYMDDVGIKGFNLRKLHEPISASLAREALALENGEEK